MNTVVKVEKGRNENKDIPLEVGQIWKRVDNGDLYMITYNVTSNRYNAVCIAGTPRGHTYGNDKVCVTKVFNDFKPWHTLVEKVTLTID